MSSENKEEILANFQSISGIDDVGEAFSILEDTNWDLMAAIRRVIPQDDPEPPLLDEDDFSTLQGPRPFSLANSMLNIPPTNNSTLNNFSNSSGSNSVSLTSTNHFNRWDTSNLVERAFVPVVASTSTKNSADADIIDLTSDIDLDPTKRNDVKTLTFNIHFNQQIYTIKLLPSATVDQLKRKISEKTNVPQCRQAIRGWPPAKLEEAQKPTTQLSKLGLSIENELILIDLTEEGYMDFENDEVSNRLDQQFKLTIVEQPSGKELTLNMSGRTTVLQVKTDVYHISDIPVRHQEWTGWPAGCDNDTTLAQSGIELAHNFILVNTAERTLATSTSNANRPLNTLNFDTDSSTDEFEDASDFNACEDFFVDSPAVPLQTRYLIPNNTDNERTGSTHFVENYIKRYGSPHPEFFSGNLEEAIGTACHKPAKERKLLAIYLHHGESILTNVFCDQLLKHESIQQTLALSFVLFGWDLTFESNKHLFLSSLTACVNNTASLTVRNISVDKLPSILIIGKSRMAGRTTCEILSVIHGNVGLDDLLSRLIESVEMYTEYLQVEIREEEERTARENIKAEQDMAYHEALQADMAKDAAKKQKEAAIVAERQRLESEKAEEDAKRESIRIVAEQSLPAEPTETDTNIAKIRVRKPSGDFLERKFFTHNKLQDLLNFVASNGFIIEEYKLLSSWPRRDLTAIDATQTLHSLKLYPQETVILEER